jgi:hypothetical protein
MKSRLLRGIAAATLWTTAVSSTGCGYFLYSERRGNSGGGVDGGTMVMRLPDSPRHAPLEFRLVTSDRRVLVRKLAVVGSDVHGQAIDLQLGAPVQETIYLEVMNADGASARFPTSIELPRTP